MRDASVSRTGLRGEGSYSFKCDRRRVEGIDKEKREEKCYGGGTRPKQLFKKSSHVSGGLRSNMGPEKKG